MKFKAGDKVKKKRWLTLLDHRQACGYCRRLQVRQPLAFNRYTHFREFGRTKQVYKTVYDHGHSYLNKTTDLIVTACLVGGVEVELSLYETPQIRNSIIDVVFKG